MTGSSIATPPIWQNVKAHGAKGDGVTDDTAPIQAAINTKQNVWFPAGVYLISAVLSMTTIGQRLEGAGIGCATNNVTITQTTSGQGAIRFVSTPDIQSPGGQGIYDFAIRSIKLNTSVAANPAAGIQVGTNGGDYGAAYFDLDDLFIAEFLIGIDFGFAGISRCTNVQLSGPGAAVAGSKGVRIQDGALPNSMLWIGLATSHYQRGLSIEGPSFGSVYFLGDFGVNGTHVYLAAGGNSTFIGGNFENYTTRAFDLQDNSTATVIGAFVNSSSSTIEPYSVGPNTSLIRMNTKESLSGATSAVTGAGYGNTSALGRTSGTVTSGDGFVWVDGPIPSMRRVILDNANYWPVNLANWNRMVAVIRDANGHGGIARIGKNASNNAFTEWISDDTPTAAANTYANPTSITIGDAGRVTAIS